MLIICQKKNLKILMCWGGGGWRHVRKLLDILLFLSSKGYLYCSLNQNQNTNHQMENQIIEWY